jgi:hypothetical protein
VDESVGGAERENREGDWRSRQCLNYIVDRPVAPAGNDRVAAVRNRAARIVGRLAARAANGKLGAHASRLENANGVVQLCVTLFSAAAGIRIKQNCSFVHALGWLYFEFEFECKFGINPEFNPESSA